MTKWLQSFYGKDMQVLLGNKHGYLRMDLYLTLPGKVRETTTPLLKTAIY